MPNASGSSPPSWTIVPQGDRTLLLVFGADIDVAIGRRCAAAAAALRAARIEGITDIVPTFNTVALHYQPPPRDSGIRHRSLTAQVEKVLSSLRDQGDGAAVSKTVDIPVCYGGEHGPDLADVAKHCGLSEDEVIALHSGVPAYVFMLGFAPGAPYIGVHDKRLAIGRRATPRTRLPAGSVAIANLQTIIYPNASPGGWHIIGATPAILFDPSQEQPALLAPGDTVQFHPISLAEFNSLGRGAA